MASALIVNVILCIGVIVMVVAPLVWAILTQHRDHPQSDSGVAPRSERRERRPAGRPQPVRGTSVIRAR